jgi:diaminopimelate epimerase
MKKIRFYKYHGTGNDFIMIDNREQKVVFDSGDVISGLCHRRFGIGADGLILLEESGLFDFRMKYFNANGIEGSMCGNGGRCTVAFAAFLGLINDSASFEAADGIHEAKIIDRTELSATISLRMSDVGSFERAGDDYILDTGSPHYVIMKDTIDGLDVVTEGRKIRYNEVYREEGINVNFVTDQRGTFKMRTYERGVEDETWSCGTGCVAAAIALELEGKTMPGNDTEIHAPGGKLVVSFNRNGNHFSNIYLTGNAVKVYEGLIESI